MNKIKILNSKEKELRGQVESVVPPERFMRVEPRG
jgi:hypothetical protein